MTGRDRLRDLLDAVLADDHRTGDRSSHWLPAPNGIHFHAPHNLWIAEGPDGSSPVTALMVHHDVDEVRSLLELAKGLPAAEYARERSPASRCCTGRVRRPRSGRC